MLAPARITKYLSLRGTSKGHLVQAPCSKQGYLEQIAQGHVHFCFESLQRQRLLSLPRQLGLMFNSAYNKKSDRFYFLSLNKTSCISVCAHWVLSYQWASLRRVWVCLPESPTVYLVLIHIDKNAQGFSAPGWTELSLSASPHMSDTSISYPPSQPFESLQYFNLFLLLQSPELSLNLILCHVYYRDSFLDFAFFKSTRQAFFLSVRVRFPEDQSAFSFPVESHIDIADWSLNQNAKHMWSKMCLWQWLQKRQVLWSGSWKI